MSTEQAIIKKNKIYTTLSAIALVLAILFVMYLLRLYPLALVGSTFIFNRDFENNVAIAKRLDPSPDKKQVFQQMIDNTKKQQLAGKVDLDAELKYYKTGRSEEYAEFLNDYFQGNENSFVKYVVAPKAFDAALAKKYNSNFGANNDAYNKASNIVDKLNQGQSFEELAKTSSDDKISGQLGGDLGFVTEGQLLPELEKVVTSSTLGEVKKQVVVSRLGYHIIYPVETAQKDGQKVWHVKHILIQTQGYDSWLKKQLDTISVRRFTSI